MLDVGGLLPNSQWPSIVDRLLDGTHAERAAARETMWIEVQRYVVRVARPPIGPLADDLEVRLDIAVSVLRRLERYDYRHLRTWRERQVTSEDDHAWWRFVATMTRSLAIDAARGSRQNLATRGEDFRWARIVPLDPALFDVAQRDALGVALDFLQGASEEDLRGYLAAPQDIQSGDGEHEADRGGGERHAELPAAPVKRKTNGGSGRFRTTSHCTQRRAPRSVRWPLVGSACAAVAPADTARPIRHRSPAASARAAPRRAGALST